MRKNKGFTLIELMIVIAIIAIIAAIAIPNLMQSRLRANEATAVTCVRNYGTAQVTFQLGGQATVASNTKVSNSGLRGFADNFRNLFYGNPRQVPTTGGAYSADSSRNLALISQANADAFGTAPQGEATQTVPTSGVADTASGTVYQGYYFTEDPDLFTTGTERFASNYAMLGLPANSSTTGNSMFWMDSENSVLRKGLTKSQDLATNLTDGTNSSPLKATANRATWSSL